MSFLVQGFGPQLLAIKHDNKNKALTRSKTLTLFSVHQDIGCKPWSNSPEKGQLQE